MPDVYGISSLKSLVVLSQMPPIFGHCEYQRKSLKILCVLILVEILPPELY